MELYIEYAFFENFIFDGALLWLALKAVKLPIHKRRLLLSAACGGSFALFFPLLRLSDFLLSFLKLAFGFFLCMLLFSRLKTKKEWGRYALTSFFFFAFSFGFGGSLLGVYGISIVKNENLADGGLAMQKIPAYVVFLGFFLLIFITLGFIQALYARRKVFQWVYDCRIFAKGKELTARGFLDSGNFAEKNGIPVCFITPELIYELWGEEILNEKEEGQVCDEMKIMTMTGAAKVPLYLAELLIDCSGTPRKRQVYFAPSKNMLSREYAILLQARIFENETGEEV